MIPQKLTGNHPLVPWLNKLRDEVIASVITSVRGGKCSRGSQGTQLTFSNIPGAGDTKAKEFRLKTVADDYVICKAWTWDSEEEEYVDGTEDVYIAKPYRLRHSITTEGGYNYTYDGSFPNKDRTKQATGGGTIETQVVIPRWIADEIITAVPAETSVAHPTSGKVGWIMVDSTKAWCKKYS